MEDHKTRNDQVQAVWFAAGTAVVIACVQRAVVVSVFKQWHMWVFLALNLLLIAILFTSTHPPRNPSNPPPKSDTSQESGKKQPPVPPVNDGETAVDNGANELNLGNKDKEGYFTDDDDEDDVKLTNLLSNDELNERVEAFISRFRQQYLVSDVKIRRSSGSRDARCNEASEVVYKNNQEIRHLHVMLKRIKDT